MADDDDLDFELDDDYEYNEDDVAGGIFYCSCLASLNLRCF